MLLTLLASLLTLRYLIPSRLDGVSGGIAGVVGRLGHQHPVWFCAALFVAFSEAGRYWVRRLQGVGQSDADTERPVTRQRLKQLLLGLVIVSLVAYVFRSSVAASYTVVGPSMLPTLESGDRVLVERFAYGFKVPFTKVQWAAKPPRRGDLVVFHASGALGTGLEGSQAIVKRIVALPGERVSVENGMTMINGWPIPVCDAGPYVSMMEHVTVRGRLIVEFLGDQTYLTVRKPVESPFPGYTVKPGEVYVLGDDRGFSSDSRFWNEGHGAGVPVDALDGKVARTLFGELPDGRVDLSPLLSRSHVLRVRLPGFDMHLTEKRIEDCLAARPTVTTPPPGH